MNATTHSTAAPPPEGTAREEAWGEPAAADSASPRGSERRAQGVERVPLTRVVEVCGLLPGAPSFRARSIDVSRRGIQLQADVLPEVATPVVLRFQQNGCAVIAEGEVAWRQRRSAGGEFGVRFTALDVHSAEALRGLGASPLNPDTAPDGRRPGRSRGPAPPPPPICEAPFTPAPPESAPRCSPPAAGPAGSLNAVEPSAETPVCAGAAPPLALGPRSDEVPPLCNPGVATSVCLRVDGLDEPITATVTESSAKGVRVASPLPFLTLGQAVDILEDRAAPRAAHVESVSLSVHPETRVPELHLALTSQPGNGERAPRSPRSSQPSSSQALSRNELPPSPSTSTTARSERARSGRAELEATERAPLLPRSMPAEAAAPPSVAPPSVAPPSGGASGGVRPPAAAQPQPASPQPLSPKVGPSASERGRSSPFVHEAPPPERARTLAASERPMGSKAGPSPVAAPSANYAEPAAPPLSESAGVAPRSTRDTQPPRAAAQRLPPPQEGSTLGLSTRLRAWLGARESRPGQLAPPAGPPPRRTAAAPPRSATSAVGVMAARGNVRTTSATPAFEPRLLASAQPPRPTRLALLLLLLLGVLFAGRAMVRRSPLSAASPDGGEAAEPREPESPVAPSARPHRGQAKATPISGSRVARTGSRVFARGRLHLPVVHRLRLDRPGHALVGTVTPSGFEVLIAERQLVDPADTLAARDQRVTHAIARQEEGGTRLILRFRGAPPPFKVRLRESRLEVLLSAEP